MSKSQNSYTYLSEEEKLSLLREYHLSGMGKKSFCKNHGIKSESSLRYWEKKYESAKDVVPLQPKLDEEDVANRSKNDYKDEIAQQKKRIRELEKALEFSRLETLARDMMIDKAEDYFDIQIRKKSGAK
ncbi:MAG: transposase [Prevotella sp.]|jgi:transposase-like protein|nr:transposase [Prevotella sp.]MBQ2208418.1 transposase [Prevotella sp.]